MSIANPTSREEMVEYIKIKLGSPVWEAHIAEAQIQVCIQDAIQFLVEKSHFNATEQTYLRFRITERFLETVKTGKQYTKNQDNGIVVNTAGQVSSLIVTSGGNGYPEKTGLTNIHTVTQAGSGRGLAVNVVTTGANGSIASVSIVNPGSGYQPGDIVIIPISGGGDAATLTIATVASSLPSYGSQVFETLRTYIVLPDSVVGVRRVVPTTATQTMGMAFAGAGIPVMGGIIGPNVGNLGMFPTGDFGSNFAMTRIYMSDLNYLFSSKLPFSFNQRTHRLMFDFDVASKFAVDSFLIMECDIAPDFDIDTGMWNDRFFKKLATAYARKEMGENMDRYQNVQLPGGLVMNGSRILADANREIKELEQEFWDQYYLPPSLIVG